MNQELRKEMRDYAWLYFERHAEQRLKTVNFYLVMCAVIIGGIVPFSQHFGEFHDTWPLWYLLSFITFVFWKLDVRNRRLIKNAERSLIHLEDSLPLEDEGQGMPHCCKLFRREQAETNLLPKLHKAFPWAAHFSYTKCFSCLFILFGGAGVLFGTTFLACKFFCC